MKKIETHELFQNVSGFLKKKGITLDEGVYTQRIQTGCRVLTDVINLTQTAVHKTKVKVDEKLEQVRQTIHEKTAPKAGPEVAPPSPAPPTPATATSATAPKVAAAKKTSRASRGKPRTAARKK